MITSSGILTGNSVTLKEALKGCTHKVTWEHEADDPARWYFKHGEDASILTVNRDTPEAEWHQVLKDWILYLHGVEEPAKPKKGRKAKV